MPQTVTRPAANTTGRLRKPITDKAVRNLKPREARYLEWFDGSLGVRVSPTNSRGTFCRTFVYWYRDGERKRLLTIGEYPAMSVEQANAARAEAWKAKANGDDPVEHKRRAKLQARQHAEQTARVQAGELTLRQVFDKWREIDLTPRVGADGERYGRKDGGAVVRQQFDKRVFPTLGDRPAKSIGKADVMAILDATKAEGKRRTASSLFSAMRQMFDFAVDRELMDRSPTATLKKLRVVGKEKHRDRVLADWEIARLLQRLPLVDMHVVTVLALRFVLATGQRPGEVAGMTKAELDKTGTLWTIPPERYKTGDRHMVPLAAYARSIVDEASAYNTGSPYVFPSPQAPERPIDRHSLSRAVLRKLGTAKPNDSEPDDGELGLAPFTPHDLRRTMRTGLAALAVPEHIAERVIGHRLQGMMAVYNQHDYLEERRAALQVWGEKLELAFLAAAEDR